MPKVYMNNSGNNKIRLASISNIILEPYFQCSVEGVFNENGMEIEINQIQLSEIQQYSSELSIADSIFVIIDFQSQYNYDANNLTGIVLDIKHAYDNIKSMSNAHIIWFGFEKYLSNGKNYLGHVYSNGRLV